MKKPRSDRKRTKYASGNTSLTRFEMQLEDKPKWEAKARERGLSLSLLINEVLREWMEKLP